jgi:hypothetical protein
MALHRLNPASHPKNRKTMKLHPIILNQALNLFAGVSKSLSLKVCGAAEAANREQ